MQEQSTRNMKKYYNPRRTRIVTPEANTDKRELSVYPTTVATVRFQPKMRTLFPDPNQIPPAVAANSRGRRGVVGVVIVSPTHIAPLCRRPPTTLPPPLLVRFLLLLRLCPVLNLSVPDLLLFCICSEKYSTALHSLFNIFERAQKIQYLTQR